MILSFSPRCDAETAIAIADAIGWNVEKIESLPVAGPAAEKFDPVSSAILVMRPERIPQPQDAIRDKVFA